jgi:hypothetical protein
MAAAPVVFAGVRAFTSAGELPRELATYFFPVRFLNTLLAEFFPAPAHATVMRYAHARAARTAAAPRDIDLSASTDAEDGAAFTADLLEFTQQGQTLALDALVDGFAVAAAGACALTLARLAS